MRKRVLIVPSWLSIEGVKGSFFREQADVMQNNFDLRFLFGNEVKFTTTSWKSFFLTCSMFFKLGEFSRESIYYIFDYPTFSFLSFRVNLKIKKWFYKLHLSKILNDKRFCPDLIHAQSTFDGGIISNYLSIIFNIPYLITEHNLFLLHTIDSNRRRNGIYALENASKVLVVSSDKARQILMHNILVNPIVIGNFLDERMFYYKLPEPKEEFVIMIVGHFSFIKDHETFFRAIHLLYKMVDIKIKVECVGFNSWGTVDNKDAIKNLAHRYGVSNICFRGIVERKNMNILYWGADLIALTSIAEGLPVCVIEALACGRPVFSTRCGGVEDIINETNGRIVAIRDSEALAYEIFKYIKKETQFDFQKISNDITLKFSSKPFSSKLSEIYVDSCKK